MSSHAHGEHVAMDEKEPRSMNIFVTDAVRQLVEYLNTLINTPEEFIANEIRITREQDALGFERWVVSAHYGEQTFKYACYVDGSNIVMDGY